MRRYGWKVVKKQLAQGTLWIRSRHMLKRVLLRVRYADPTLRKRIVLRREYDALKRRYFPLIAHRAAPAGALALPSNKVWICWLQGFEAAPHLVRACLHSVRKHLPEREIILLTEKNYAQYAEIPAFILEKHRRGRIPHAQLSDILRTEVLLRRGGLWMDATIYMSGSNLPANLAQLPLFVFSTSVRDDADHYSVLSNWLIPAGAGHPILAATRDLLYAYWRRENRMRYYFLYHMLFTIATEAYPELWEAVPRVTNAASHALAKLLHAPYDAEAMRALAEKTCFHKLRHHQSGLAGRPGIYYDALLGAEDAHEAL